jgi:uncharacterized lipoprotein YajG
MRIIGVLTILGSLLLVVGCAKEDKTLEAAPPPAANARPETMGGQPKAAPQNAPMGMQGAVSKPAGM